MIPAPRPPPSHLSSEQVVSLSKSSCVSPVERTDGRGGRRAKSNSSRNHSIFSSRKKKKIALLFSFSLYVDFLLVFHGHTEEASSTVTHTQLQTHNPTSSPLHLPSADIQAEPEYDKCGNFSDNWPFFVAILNMFFLSSRNICTTNTTGMRQDISYVR